MDILIKKLWPLLLLLLINECNCAPKRKFNEIRKLVVDIVNKGEKIDQVLIPEGLEEIGQGSNGIIWKGINYLLCIKKKHV